MGSKSSDKTVWELALEERNRAEAEAAKQALSGDQDMASPHGSESTIFITGSKNCGKTSMILRFLDRDEAPKPTTALGYTFGRKARGHNIAKDIGHIWELGGGAFLSKLVDIPITIESISAVDEMKKNAWKRFGKDHPDKSFVEPFPVPLAIIGGKYDIYQDLDPEKRKMISKALRFVAHSNGAHLQFFSTKSENLTGRARALIGHLLFHTSLSKSVSLEHSKPIIVPAGLDTLNQIGAPPVSSEDLGKLQSRSPYDLWKASYATFFPPENVHRNQGDDPSKDPQFYESAVDAMRKQKDEELERYRKMAERKAREAKMAHTDSGKSTRVR
ncbi:Cytoplasmic dynein 2 light intermediate chain 1 [Exaiptasia diaphana]|nr:Cytoplasmic dynein 2 light intermediate chain 1 [Exaiptasia diaphana]